MKKLVVLIAMVAFSCIGDNNSDDVNCTLEAKAGLVVTVKDSATGLELQEGVTVTATDGTYSEVLQYGQTSSSTFVGAWERAGNYILTVSKEGYQTFASDVIVVTADVCHVIPQSVTVELQPE